MTESKYSLHNITREMPSTLAQYLEAQYHIWDESLVRKRRALLDQVGVISAAPYLEATPMYVAGKPYGSLGLPPVVSALLASAATDPKSGVPSSPYQHQAEALEAFFQKNAEIIVSTGTGSGKTESFLMPIIGSLAVERASRPATYAMPATRALLLYPMNALVNDQMARLRRLLGSDKVAGELKRSPGPRATFGMYTSRTPYPGPSDPNRTRRDVGGWIDNFFTRYAPQRRRLEAEGKWPSKDLVSFRQSFTTSDDDSEMLTRQEMQQRPPDILVTNYSMLEYMLLRPVDAPLFGHTRRWLAADEANKLIVVLDEAHLYQGAQGTEVALLLRRLVSRLRVPRDRVRFILTSASLADGDDAIPKMQLFASQLTGSSPQSRPFSVIRGLLDRPTDGRPATKIEANALAKVDVDSLLQVEEDFAAALVAGQDLASALSFSLPSAIPDQHALRDALFAGLTANPVARQLAGMIMGVPTKLDDIADRLFPNAHAGPAALDAILAGTAIARRSVDSRVLLPSRAHLLFRGLEGVYACVNTNCTAQSTNDGGRLLGKLRGGSGDSDRF